VIKERKNIWVQLISLVGLLWIASGHFMPLNVIIAGKDIIINAFSEFYLIPVFGIWRIRTEKDVFQKKRIKWMMLIFLVYWILFSFLIRNVPVIDGSVSPVVTSYHTIGSVGFFLFFIAVLLFGKRADCGWNCTCVFTRETVGFAFRHKTKKGKFWWNLRHLKWIMLVLVWAFFIYMIINPENAVNTYKKPMYRLILDLYYGTILLIPFIGHRNICRFVCPWSATWAVLNRIGPYKIIADTSKCVNCEICEKECDMGIPIIELIHKSGSINTGECMGCERCVRKCPKQVLKIVDFRDKIPGFNLSSKNRAIRVIAGLTFFLFVFTGWNKLFVGLIVLISILLFLSGLFGYCPVLVFTSKKNVNKIEEEVDINERLKEYIN